MISTFNETGKLFGYDSDGEFYHETVPLSPTQEWADEFLRQSGAQALPADGTKELSFFLSVMEQLQQCEKLQAQRPV